MADKNKPPISQASRRTYTLEFKLGVLEWMKSHGSSVRGTARRFGIHRRMVQRWMERETELSQAFMIDGAQRKKVHHHTKQPLFQDLERKLMSWFVKQRELGTTISDSNIKTQALFTATSIGLEGFKASSAWISSFKKRHDNFLYRNRTNSSFTDPCPAVSINPLHLPRSGEALLAHTNPNESIRLIFMEGNKSDQFKKQDEAFVYFDYQTPEHNYCRMEATSACTPTTRGWGSHHDFVLIDENDEQVALGHEETVGREGDEGIKVVVEFPSRDSCSSKGRERTNHIYVPPFPLLDIDGVLTVGDRTYQPEFTICPELVLLGR